MGDDMADDVVAVVREGLANAARHARATAVAVGIELTAHPGGSVTVVVDDDGSGLPPARDRRSGTENLAARARRHGGTFTLTPSPQGRGTRLRWVAPLARG
ncbi:ATP-binding protein [Cellulomonas sp. ATA003]|uniref:sensor histidine kinase n=1 Tax=Cellulomonas sp. ATA003 TaxID=3073064 RepID=UPI002873DC32|nr:ATP-binding protein [Cellulomonas sp. ATA003]WNB87098.1 ATP-binding protein [Cellulomonas sp. ATA003]